MQSINRGGRNKRGFAKTRIVPARILYFPSQFCTMIEP